MRSRIGEERPRRRLSLMGVVMAASALGTVVAIIVPNLPKFRAHGRQQEAKATLLRVYAAQTARFAVHGSYVSSIAQLGVTLPRENRYTLALSTPTEFTGVLRDSPAPDAPGPATSGICADRHHFGESQAPCKPAETVSANVTAGSTGSFIATVAANLDHDGVRDEWSISSEYRAAGSVSSATTCASGEAPAGEPCHDVDDIAR